MTLPHHLNQAPGRLASRRQGWAFTTVGMVLICCAGLLVVGCGLCAAGGLALGVALNRLPADVVAPSPVTVGAAAPDFTATSLAGAPITLSAFRGAPVVITFWASWCEPCREEMPVLQAAYTRYAGEGLVWLAVNAGETRDEVQTYWDAQALTLTPVLDEDAAVEDLYDVTVIPVSIWVDRQGVVQGVFEGGLTETQVERYLAKLLAP